jgi:hypothetical protein
MVAHIVLGTIGGFLGEWAKFLIVDCSLISIVVQARLAPIYSAVWVAFNLKNLSAISSGEGLANPEG